MKYDPQEAIEKFQAAGVRAALESYRGKAPARSGMIRLRFTAHSGIEASWWFSCKSGRWLQNQRWSNEFGAKGVDACLAAIATAQRKTQYPAKP